MSTIISPPGIDTRLSTNGTTHGMQPSASADITGTLMRISPAMASDLLKNRLRNRPISKARIRALIDDLRSGRWTLNGESIILDADLRLLDGQHRLLACQESGIPIDAFVVVGVAAEALPSIDQGKSKIAADFLSMHGMTNAPLLASTARWLFRYERGTMRQQTSQLRNHQLSGFVESRPALEITLPWGRAIRDLVPAAPAAMLYYVMSHKEPAAAKHYFDDLSGGVGLSRDAPAHIIREKLLKDKSPRSHAGIVRRAALGVLGWNALRSEKALPVSITWRGGEDSTVPFPQVL